MKGNAGSNGAKIGVYVCHCGTNISGKVDISELVEFLKGLPEVATVKDYKFMCSDPGQELIQKDIENLGLTRVVVASCSPLMHEITFRKACEKAGMNGYFFQMANIREQCSWVTVDGPAATEKAKALVRAAVRRAALHEALMPKEVSVTPAALIVGGGIAGIQAALDIADSGTQVYLVEKEPSIGGNMAKFDKTFPTLDCSACILTPKMVRVGQHEKIKLMTLSEVEEVSGYVGNFKVKVRKKARFVDIDKCTGCGECEKICPVSVPSEFDHGLGTRKAVYRPFAQAVPSVFAIDKKETAPCTLACPIQQDIPAYLTLTQEGKFEEAIQAVRRTNPLPVICGRVCHHPCDSVCKRADADSPVAIREVKRFLSNYELRLGGGELTPPLIGKPKFERVAIIGSGPAGLACAHDLALLGYTPTIFEELPVAGGMLAVGIPDYGLPRELLRKEIDYIKKMGVEIRTNTKVGRDITLPEMKSMGFSSAFLAIGAHSSARAGITGEDLDGVINGLDFLRMVNLGKKVSIGKTVACIGGGNTALAAARAAAKLGAKVTLVYRRTRAEMPARQEDIAAAESEGIEFLFQKTPVEFTGNSGRLEKVRLIGMKPGDPCEPGRPGAAGISGSEELLECDSVILAIGRRPDLSFADAELHLPTSKNGTLAVGPDGASTEELWIFAGGDLVSGPATVIDAIASGKKAAIRIHSFLRGSGAGNAGTGEENGLKPGTGGEPVESAQETGTPVETTAAELAAEFREVWRDLTADEALKQASRCLKCKRRNTGCSVCLTKTIKRKITAGLGEALDGLTVEQAIKESSRCLKCGVCVDCLECVSVCDPNAIDHSMIDEIEEIDVGAIILATGFQALDASLLTPYGYGQLGNVITSLEFERMLSSSGPTGGEILTDKGKKPESIAIIHCAGSRDQEYHEYCSRVCCMYGLKFAHLARERTNADVYEMYIDMRCFGKGYEEFYNRLLEEEVRFIRGKAAEVTDFAIYEEEKHKLIVRVEDTLVGVVRRIPVDMVILCNALEARSDADEVARLFSISRGKDGFFLERHPKLAPVATTTDGVFLAGCCQGPKDIPDSVAQGQAAAASVLSLIMKGKVEIEPTNCFIDPDICSGCKICNVLCSYKAISYSDAKKVSEINDAVCKGCGVCASACPSMAITARHFTEGEILAEIDGLLAGGLRK